MTTFQFSEIMYRKFLNTFCNLWGGGGILLMIFAKDFFLGYLGFSLISLSIYFWHPLTGSIISIYPLSPLLLVQYKNIL